MKNKAVLNTTIFDRIALFLFFFLDLTKKYETPGLLPLKKASLNAGVEMVDRDRIPREAIRRLEAIRKVEQDRISQGDV